MAEAAWAGPIQDAYSAVVEAAADTAGGPVSLWRYGDEGPELMACAGVRRGENEETGLLAAMKESAAVAFETGHKHGVAKPNTAAPAAGAERRFEALRVRSGSEDWGAIVFDAGIASGCEALLKAVSAAIGLVEERNSLNAQLLALRARTAAAERERTPDDRYATIGQLAFHAYREIDEILKAVVTDLGRRTPETGGKTPGAVSELKRARAIVNDHLDLAKLEMPVLEMRDLNVIAQGAVSALEERIHSKGLRLMKRLAPGLPKLLLDEDKVAAAVRKVLAAAVGRSPVEGWLRVETAHEEQDVVLQVTWEEKGSPGGATDHMFLPFGALEGGGMGLMVASQIIREHGGGVRVQHYESGSTALILDFPVGDNQDRRRKCRRSGLDRRRPQ